MSYFAEYIWLDGYIPANIRAKTRVLKGGKPPVWSFDGSSTEQSTSISSDCILVPCLTVPDPIRGGDNVLVLCEVKTKEGEVHSSNQRDILKGVTSEEKVRKAQPQIGFEQEYTLVDSRGRPLGFPSSGFPDPQGEYYCGVGANQVAGRAIAEEHAQACLDCGIWIGGLNAEVLLGQWEFQIGHGHPLVTSDHLILARWLLHRIAEKAGVSATLHPKPVKGNWNGAGCHANFSTYDTRLGKLPLGEVAELLRETHSSHIFVYGEFNSERLTGKHETAPIDNFSYGIADRSASIRIPFECARDKCGYFEDRRPAANCDPYLVSTMLIRTVVLNVN